MQSFIISKYKVIYAKDRATAISIWLELRRKGIV